MNRNKVKYASDAALMGAVTLGMQEALNEVLDRYMPIVSRTSYRILCDRDDSGEVTRNVFLKIWRSASDFDGRYSLLVWIYRITCGQCYHRLLRRKVLSIFSTSPSVFETSAPHAASPEEDFITKESWEIYCRASRYLSPKQRMVFTLCDLEGLDIEDVGSVIEMSLDNIKSNLHIARETIVQELQRYGKVR